MFLIHFVTFLNFLFSGAILLIATILMALTTRKLELDIMRIKGISGVDSYYSFLTHMEGKKEKVEANVRMGMDQLRVSLQFLAIGFSHIKLNVFFFFRMQHNSRKIKIQMKTITPPTFVSHDDT